MHDNDGNKNSWLIRVCTDFDREQIKTKIAMDFKESDLILLRVPNEPEYEGRQRHYNIWVRVLFKDDSSSNGKIERCPSFACGGYYANKKGDTVQFENTKVLEVFNENDGNHWCYSDDVTRCNCPGLCRNK